MNGWRWGTPYGVVALIYALAVCLSRIATGAALIGRRYRQHRNKGELCTTRRSDRPPGLGGSGASRLLHGAGLAVTTGVGVG